MCHSCERQLKGTRPTCINVNNNTEVVGKPCATALAWKAVAWLMFEGQLLHIELFWLLVKLLWVGLVYCACIYSEQWALLAVITELDTPSNDALSDANMRVLQLHRD